MPGLDRRDVSSRARKTERPQPNGAATSSPHAADVLSLALLAGSLITGLALATYHADDASWGSATGQVEVRNAVGPFGAHLAWTLHEIGGYVSWLLPVVLAAAGVTLYRRRTLRVVGLVRAVSSAVLCLALTAVLALSLGSVMADDHFPPGGVVGKVIAAGMVSGLGTIGAWIVAVTLAVASVLVVTKLSLQDAAEGARAGTSAALSGMRSATSRLREGLSPRETELLDEPEDDEPEDDEPEEPPRGASRRKPKLAVVADEEEDDEPPARPAAPPPRPRVARGRLGAEEEAAPEPEPEAPPRKPGFFHLKLRMRRPGEAAPEKPSSARPVLKPAVAAVPAPAEEERPQPIGKPRMPRPSPPSRAAAPPPPPPPPDEDGEDDEKESPAAPTRSSESGFLQPAAKEILATAASGEPAPSVGARAQIAKAVRKAAEKQRDFRLPPTNLLDEPGQQYQVEESELMECAGQIVAKCGEFGIGGQVLHIHPGPVVTTYELKPDAGVKFSRLCSLEDDLALALKAETIRIDRIPGKNTVGIEVPNRRRETISFRELGESDVFSESASRLTLILGKTIDGAPYVADLAKMPHLLIAGSTGSGKSVALNSMITSLLFKATPEEVKLIMVDPKMIELGMYKDIPHLLTPVVVNPKLASNALKWAVKEMEQRYARLAGCGVRNIEQYNAWVKRSEEKDGKRPLMPDGAEHAPLPFIVIVIDELADLMMVAAGEVEDSICRLAQMARAIGIHLILATQRPSVDVITGVIKANLPSRLAMRVASKVDSRTILDSNGAEQLLGKGDMLFLPTGSSRLMRLHGPYLSETETAQVCDYLRTQREPVYDEKVCEDDAAASAQEGGPGGPKDDELFEQAARTVVERGEASVSYLQRRLKVGYSRAARLVDMLESDGIVGPADGSKAREVLVGPDYFAELDRARHATGG